MNGSTYRIRRATLDDLDALRPLWESMRLPVADLERRLIEFQVAESPEGKIVGAIGFPGMPAQVDMLVTGLAIGSGTKPLHDLISSLQKSKENREDPPELTGSM